MTYVLFKRWGWDDRPIAINSKTVISVESTGNQPAGCIINSNPDLVVQGQLHEVVERLAYPEPLVRLNGHGDKLGS